MEELEELKLYHYKCLVLRCPKMEFHSSPSCNLPIYNMQQSINGVFNVQRKPFNTFSISVIKVSINNISFVTLKMITAVHVSVFVLILPDQHTNMHRRAKIRARKNYGIINSKIITIHIQIGKYDLLIINSYVIHIRFCN